MNLRWGPWLGASAFGGALALALAGAPFAQSSVQAPAPSPADAAGQVAPALPAPTGAASTPAGAPGNAPLTTQVQDTTKIDESKATLEEIENSLSLSNQRVEELKKQVEDLQGDRARQNAALIAAAQRLKIAEIEITSMQERLSNLLTEEVAVKARLDGADADISNILAALERISRNPPPALIVDPGDALGSARGAMLISAILPQLRDKAKAISADLERLETLKAEARKQQSELEADYAVLEEEQLRIATLIAARKQGEEAVSQQMADEERQAQELASKADSLKSLIAALSRRAAAVEEAAAAAHAAAQGQTPPQLDPETIRIALANTARVEPAIPFEAARGYLMVPATGIDVMDFGANDGFGGISRGTSYVTKPDAQVVAPADGWVLYKGPYLNYGQIVVLNPGQNYTILLAGLDKVDVDIGQFVLMGEPVGTMGSRTIGRTIATGAGVSQPTLYIELRKNNDPIDPTGWWAPPNSTGNG